MRPDGGIIPNSQNDHFLYEVYDDTQTPVTSSQVLVQLSATNGSGATVLPATTVTASGPASDGTYTWKYTSQASCWVPGAGPWTEHWLVSDPTGTTPYRDFKTVRSEVQS